LEEFKILYPLQFGFREKNVRLPMLLFLLLNFFFQSIDNSEFGCGIFIDLKKAFDILNHTILLSKLNHYDTNKSMGSRTFLSETNLNWQKYFEFFQTIVEAMTHRFFK